MRTEFHHGTPSGSTGFERGIQMHGLYSGMTAVDVDSADAEAGGLVPHPCLYSRFSKVT